MSQQLALPGFRAPVLRTRGDEIEEEALRYLGEHPEFWRLFCRFSFELIGAGRSRYGAKAIVERIRWETVIRGGDDYKVNNNHTAIFARVFRDTYPEHAHLFEIRERISARRAA